MKRQCLYVSSSAVVKVYAEDQWGFHAECTRCNWQEIGADNYHTARDHAQDHARTHLVQAVA